MKEKGCLGTIVKWFLIVVIFCFVVDFFADDDTATSTAPTPTEAPVSQTQTPDVPEDEYAEYGLTQEEVSAFGETYLHQLYTDLDTVEIHEFDERVELIAKVKDLMDENGFKESAMNLDEENPLLFGNDYYYITQENTGLYYYGETKDNKPDGFGIIVRESEGTGTYQTLGMPMIEYMGEFEDGMLDGFGLVFSGDGADIIYAISSVAELDLLSEEELLALSEYLFNFVSYEGFLKENQPHGKGNSFSFPVMDEQYVITDMLTPVLDGYVYANAYPDVTKGEYENGELSGDVSIYSSNVLIYQGEMEDGKKDGDGTLYYADGTIHYDGSWKADNAHGTGTSYNPDGSVAYDGKWDNGDYAH